MRLDKLPQVDFSPLSPALPRYEKTFIENARARFLDVLERVVYDQMTAAARRAFAAAWRLDDSSRGFTRAQLGAALGRRDSRLLPHDRRILNAFVQSGLLLAYRRAKPLKAGRVSGYELVYKVSPAARAGMPLVARRRRPAAAAAAAPVPESVSAAPVVSLDEAAAALEAAAPLKFWQLFKRGGGNRD